MPGLAAGGFLRADALIQIPGATNLYYGGERLSNTMVGTIDEVIRTAAQPFTIHNLGTISPANMMVPNKGFDLSWNQVPCGDNNIN